MSDQEFVYKSTLKERFGLTDSLIRKLGAPDKQVPNPHYRSGPPASLYAIDRVEAWCAEHSKEIEKARRYARLLAERKDARAQAFR